MQRQLIFLAFFLTAFAFDNRVRAQENYEIREINFVGNDSIEDDALLDPMVMYPLSYLEKKLTKKEPSLYNRELLETDLERLTRYYQREGFIDVHVELEEIKKKDKKKKVDLTFKIEQGMPFTVDSIRITDSDTSGKRNNFV